MTAYPLTDKLIEEIKHQSYLISDANLDKAVLFNKIKRLMLSVYMKPDLDEETLIKLTSDLIGLFLKAMIICSLLEYFTSYIMEKIFKTRWWDYSDRSYNINGRICLLNMLCFGMLGCLLMYIINPILTNILLNISPTEWLITFIAIGMVLAAELVNTAIEAIVDLVTLEIHPLAKIAKDCGSAATFVLAMMAAAIGFVVYIPHIIELVKNLIG